jgi:[ribosomal protein S5]-alanine N-acetyltransferase
VNELHTSRLVGTPAGPGDFAGIRRLHGDSRVMATLSADGNAFSEASSEAFLKIAAEHWEAYGFGLWAFRERAGGGFVGYGGIKHAVVETRDEIELAYAIIFEHWGKSLATEISRAALTFAFDVMRLPRIVAFTLPHNRASRRVMERCGFTFQRNIVHAGLPHVFYSLEATTFARP